MAEEQGFTQARARLEEIVVQVRKKDTSLEQSLDLLEEGVRLANLCTELVDHSEWKPSADAAGDEGAESAESTDTANASPGSGLPAAVAALDGPAVDEPATDQAADAETAFGGMDAAEPVDEAKYPRSAAEADDEYDDIFADED